MIAAWPSFALIAPYELLQRQVRAGLPRVTHPGSDPAGSAADQNALIGWSARCSAA
jgi:hypothetical protein